MDSKNLDDILREYKVNGGATYQTGYQTNPDNAVFERKVVYEERFLSFPQFF